MARGVDGRMGRAVERRIDVGWQRAGRALPPGWGAAPDFRQAIYSIQAADLFRCSAAEEGHGFSVLCAGAIVFSTEMQR
ncbi:unnamed protein product [Arctia plantaginis]|uniref:Uncharacterized protein n=1 Tax=Arctia plantaginis TaxID=874455 RepID=A0A8S1AGR6_ARCPL|nr:unnamed protein product [Arctia plantaginis]